jgi:hypothetical protein
MLLREVKGENLYQNAKDVKQLRMLMGGKPVMGQGPRPPSPRKARMRPSRTGSPRTEGALVRLRLLSVIC